MKDYLDSFKRLVRDDWVLMIVALVVATVFWWNTTQRQVVKMLFTGVEVDLKLNLRPSLKLAQTQKERPIVNVFVEGPKSYMEALTSDSFHFVADTSQIQGATKQVVLLKPEDLVPKAHLVPVLPVHLIKVPSPEDILPRRIEVETVWNKAVTRIVPKISGRPAVGYIISSSQVSPATLTVAGLELPPTISNTTELALHGESRSFSKMWSVDDLNLGNLEVLDWRQERPIRLDVVIEPQFMEVTFRRVQVNVVAATDETRDYNFEPKNVDIDVQGARSRLQSVTRTSFALEIDMSKIEIDSGTRYVTAKFLKPTKGFPSGCEIRAVTPAMIAVQIVPPPGPVLPVRPALPEAERLATPFGPADPTPTEEPDRAAGDIPSGTASTTTGEAPTESAPPSPIPEPAVAEVTAEATAAASLEMEPPSEPASATPETGG